MPDLHNNSFIVVLVLEGHCCAWHVLVLPQFGSEPRFELEPFRTRLKFSSKFKDLAQLNRRFSSGFKQEEQGMNLFKPVSNCDKETCMKDCVLWVH